MTVLVYSQPKCRGCARVKKMLNDAGVEFEEVDILKNRLAYEHIKYLGATSVPVIEADGFEPIVGYDPTKLKELIGAL